MGKQGAPVHMRGTLRTVDLSQHSSFFATPGKSAARLTIPVGGPRTGWHVPVGGRISSLGTPHGHLRPGEPDDSAASVAGACFPLCSEERKRGLWSAGLTLSALSPCRMRFYIGGMRYAWEMEDVLGLGDGKWGFRAFLGSQLGWIFDCPCRWPAAAECRTPSRNKRYEVRGKKCSASFPPALLTKI